MEEDLLENIKEGTVYPVKTIVISTFFGGLLAGALMLYQNFKTFGDHKKARLTVVLTAVTFIALLATVFVPFFDNIPGIAYSGAITLGVIAMVKKYQESLIAKHVNSGGKTYGTGRAVLICVISIIIVVAFYLGVFFLQEASFQNQ